MTKDQVTKNEDESGRSASGIAAPIWITFSLVLLTLAAVGTVSYRSMQQFALSSGWVAHTYIVIGQLKTLLDTIDGAVSAQRLYVLTGDETKLEPVTSARSSGARVMRSLAALTADNPVQQRRLVELRPLLDAQFSSLEKVVATRAQLGRDAAISFIRGHDTPELTGQIHSLAGAMIGAEDELLKDRGRAEGESAHFALRVLGIGAFAAFCFVTAAALYVQRTIARLRHVTRLGLQRSRELVRSESALRAQSALLQSVFDAMGEGVIVAYCSTSAPTLNPAARRILAIDESMAWSDWLRNASIWQEGRAEPLASEDTPFARLANDPASGEIEMLLRQPVAGGLVAIAAIATRLTGETGVPVGGVMVLRDITERKRGERIRALLAALIDSTQYAILTMRADQIVLTWNPGGEKLYGYSADEMVGRSIKVLNPPGRDPKAGNLLMSRLAAGGGTEEFETACMCKDGTVIDVAAAMAPMRGARGEVIAISSISYDITDRKRAQQELLARTEELTRSNAELEQFAYVASHDLQEPLRMVASYLQLIEQRYKGKLDADADDFINFAVDGAVRMKQLINDLLIFSRAGRGAKSAVVNLTEVVEHVLEVLQLAIEDAHATVTHDPMPSVICDEGRLSEVVQNLVGNALKFRGERTPQVHIGCERHGEEWMFSVRDNGIGIAPEFYEQIFVMFQRLHGREEFSGTGIGLAVCKRVIEHHGGRIWVESTPAQGTTFFFTLPTASEVLTNESAN